MSDDSLRPVVFRYYLYQATATVSFVTPIFTLYLLYHELSYTQIATLSVLFSVLVVGLEVPTGYVGDRFGRRTSLVAGKVASALSLAGFVVADTYPAFLVLYALWALALTFRSGSADAWLYDALRERLAEGTFTRVRGRGGAVNRWASALTMIVGGLLYALDPRYPFVGAVALNVLCILVLFTLPRNEQYRETDERLTVVDALPVVRRRLTDPPLRSFVLYLGCLFGVVWAANEYVQPITVAVLETRISGLSVAGYAVPEVATLGVLYAGFSLVSSIASYYAGDVEDALGVRRVVTLVPVGLGVVLLVPAVVPLLAIPVFVAMRGANTLLAPIANGYVNDRVGSVGRATVLSAASMVYALVRIPFYLVGGVTADVFGPLAALAGLGGMFLALAALVFLREPPVASANAAERPGSTGAE